ncbi:MAG: Protein DedA [Steroidobacteraceae bacterium]|nr:Protein DedA [Steroidobacteraceae bacterium]
MELLQALVDFVLHLDRHLVELLVRFDVWIYAIVFLVVFAETGFVVTPFLPGDSLLFALGALAAVDTSGTLTPTALVLSLGAAAILGNTANYAIGARIGPPAFSGRYRFLKVEYLRETEDYFRRYGPMTIVLSRFVPIVRTFAPFVAGIGRMPYWRFQAYNIAGGAGWVAAFIAAGYLFGNLPWIKRNFGLVTVLIIVVSVIPMGLMLIRARRERAALRRSRR